MEGSTLTGLGLGRGPLWGPLLRPLGRQRTPALSRGPDPATQLRPSLREPAVGCPPSLPTLTPSWVGTPPPPGLQGTGLEGGRHQGPGWSALKPPSDLKGQRGRGELHSADPPESPQRGRRTGGVNIPHCSPVAGSRPGSQQATSLLRVPLSWTLTCPGHPARWAQPGQVQGTPSSTGLGASFPGQARRGLLHNPSVGLSWGVPGLKPLFLPATPWPCWRAGGRRGLEPGDSVGTAHHGAGGLSQPTFSVASDTHLRGCRWGSVSEHCAWYMVMSGRGWRFLLLLLFKECRAEELLCLPAHPPGGWVAVGRRLHLASLLITCEMEAPALTSGQHEGATGPVETPACGSPGTQ